MPPPLPGPGGARTGGRESPRPSRSASGRPSPPDNGAVRCGEAPWGWEGCTDRARRYRSGFPRFLVLAPHLEGWEWCLWWTGLLDVSNHDSEPRGWAGRVPGHWRSQRAPSDAEGFATCLQAWGNSAEQS